MIFFLLFEINEWSCIEKLYVMYLRTISWVERERERGKQLNAFESVLVASSWDRLEVTCEFESAIWDTGKHVGFLQCLTCPMLK